MNGLLVIDKPGGVTSRDAVNRVQRLLPRRTKIGHTGTLDPLATGTLVVCIGCATRLAEYVQAMDKSYASRFRLGATSTTDDADGEVRVNEAATPPSRDAIDAALARFVGVVEQRPPAFSALKVGGRRAHDLARRGDTVPLAVRPVRVDAIRVLHYDWPWLDVEIDCGKGTYIRSIARDLGEQLGVGGLVQTLRRTRIGPFTAEQGVSPDCSLAEVERRVLPPLTALAGLPQIQLDRAAEERFRRGQSVPATAAAGEVAVLDVSGELIGVGLAGRELQPRIVLAL
jgi:tRNA pseudouridine55 synthase